MNQRTKGAILILLMANIPCFATSTLREELPGIGISMALLLPGLFCSYIGYQAIQKLIKENKEIAVVKQSLKDMDVKLSEENVYNSKWNTLDHIVTIHFPDGCSQDQKNRARLLMEKLVKLYEEKESAGSAIWGTLPFVMTLVPLGLAGTAGCINRLFFRTDSHKIS